MPVLPPSSLGLYEPVQNALQTARVRLREIVPVTNSYSGSILDHSNASTQMATNAAWRRMQESMASIGLWTFTGDRVITGLPACVSTDPSDQAFLAWGGCSDGVNIYPSPTLPSDLMSPLKLWERQSGIDMLFIPMEQMLDGLPNCVKGILSRRWEWREDAIWFPGAQQITDFRIRYLKYMADFLDVGTVQWFDQSIPIVHGSDALAWFLVGEFIAKDNPETAAMAFDQGEAAVRKIINRDNRARQRVNVRRQPRRGYGGGCGWY